MLKLFLHMLMQDFMKAGRFNRVEQLLELLLVRRKPGRTDIVVVSRGSRDNCDGEKSNQEEGEEVLGSRHVDRLSVVFFDLQISASGCRVGGGKICSVRKMFLGVLGLFSISWMHLPNQKGGS
jgi:hypothetical protein